MQAHNDPRNDSTPVFQRSTSAPWCAVPQHVMLAAARSRLTASEWRVLTLLLFHFFRYHRNAGEPRRITYVGLQQETDLGAKAIASAVKGLEELQILAVER